MADMTAKPENPPACRLRGGLCTCPVNACRVIEPVTRIGIDTIPLTERTKP